jgi:hypothetical protein
MTFFPPHLFRFLLHNEEEEQQRSSNHSRDSGADEILTCQRNEITKHLHRHTPSRSRFDESD